MKLSASNIGWAAEDDSRVYEAMKARGFSGVEIAPTRLFDPPAYEKNVQAAAWAKKMGEEYGFSVPSIQSIWYGRGESIFGTEQERELLIDYTKQAVDFAAVIGCPSLVFGCPKNRAVPEGGDPQTAIAFFNAVGAYAAEKGCMIALEANPPIYNTNYMNTTPEAFAVAEQYGEGVSVNFDFGTVIQNGEDLSVLEKNLARVSHIHISEPNLAPIEKRQQHRELAALLNANGYDRFVSIEMKTQPFGQICAIMDYIAEVFG